MGDGPPCSLVDDGFDLFDAAADSSLDASRPEVADEPHTGSSRDFQMRFHRAGYVASVGISISTTRDSLANERTLMAFG